MKFRKQHANSLLFILLELIIGILLLINPMGFTKTIIQGAGVLMLIVGATYVVKYVRSTIQEAAVSLSLTKGLLILLAGWFCTFHSGWFIATFPALTILYGVAMLVGSLGKVQMTVDLLRLKSKFWFWCAISAAVSIIGSVVIISNPFATVAVLWMFTGIALIAEAVLDGVSFFFGGKDRF